MPAGSDNPSNAPRKPIAFCTTRWTQVLQAQGQSPDAQAALSDLCKQYYLPVEAFIRQRAGSDRAQDLTQAFFAKLLKDNRLQSVQSQNARFRSYLLGAVKHFLSDQKDHDQAAKRGGGVPPIFLQSSTDTSPGLDLPDPSASSPEKEYDRQWAVTLLNHCLQQLRIEFEASAKADQFDILKHWLPGSPGMSQPEATARLQMSDGALKVAIHRLRKRFRDRVKNEIAQTVTSEDEVKEELRYLIDILS
jgi:DNA-directed RNA polymerase specialized sigma24 family protein